MRAPVAALALMLLNACAAPGPVPEAAAPAPLASDAEIDAAIAAPVTGFAADMRWNEPSAPFTVIGNIHCQPRQPLWSQGKTRTPARR